MQVGLLISCFNDTLFPGTGRAVVELLERLGQEVVFPEEQTCCGQLHVNAGYGHEALPLAWRTVRAFADLDAVVTPSGSCAANICHQYPRLAEEAGDAALALAVADLTPRVYEICTFLADVLGAEDVGATFPHRVAYHPTCHSLRLLQVGDAPERLLRGVRGLELVDLPSADSCCGFGGTFAVKNSATSTAMLTDKMRAILDSGAEVCAAVDNSCLMQIQGGLSRARAGVRTMHVAEILAARE
jgi:L-lactate dehydrogenase complex protein LldE